MITITHNIEGALYRLGRIRPALESARLDCLDPQRWANPLKFKAEEVLMPLAGNAALQAAIGRFIGSFGIEATENGFTVTLGYHYATPRDGVMQGDLSGLQSDYAAANQGDPNDLFTRSVRDFERIILEWVGTPEERGGKARDHRDWGKSDDEVAALITRIMLAPDPSPKMQAAREGLLPHIVNFLHRGNTDLSPDLIAAWLLAVLAAWRDKVKADLPPLFRAQFRRHFTGSGLALGD